ncbi:MAG: dTDP-glucose 4,6-dehydratase [Planctomycetota bacterium]
MAPQTILLTGGAGFVGANFARLVLRETDHRVVVFDKLTYSGNLENLDGLEAAHGDRYAFVRGDVCDRPAVDAVLDEHRPDAIVHMAAESHVDRSIIDATPFVRTNVIGTQTIVDAIRARLSSERLVHVSTDEVYGDLPLDRPELFFNESSPLAPSSPYAASKAGSDLVVLSAHRTFGIDAVVTRGSNNFGPYQYPEKVIPLFATNLIDGLKVPLYGDGQNVRDWIHVDDHNAGVLAALERGAAGEVYNLGGKNERSNLELTRELLRCFGVGEEMIDHVADRPGHDRRYSIDISKATRELGWSPASDRWEDALESTVRWYRENEAWWRPLKSGEHRAFYERQYGRR